MIGVGQEDTKEEADKYIRKMMVFDRVCNEQHSCASWLPLRGYATHPESLAKQHFSGLAEDYC